MSEPTRLKRAEWWLRRRWNNRRFYSLHWIVKSYVAVCEWRQRNEVNPLLHEANSLEITRRAEKLKAWLGIDEDYRYPRWIRWGYENSPDEYRAASYKIDADWRKDFTH